MKARLLGAVGILAIVAGLAGVLTGQTPVSPAFEVASVKPHQPGDLVQGGGGFQPGGRLALTNYTLRTLIVIAYTGPDFERLTLVGGPSWLSTDHFDVVARADRDYPPDRNGRPSQEILAMLRTLLANRFKLVTHMETQERRGYALTVARADGRLGPKLRPSDDVNCDPGRRGGSPPAPRPQDGRGPTAPCGTSVGPGRLTSHERSMPLLSADLTVALRQLVVDRTGLGGNFDIDLSWDPADSQLPTPVDGADSNDRSAGAGASIFTAVQEQLGLKLVSTKEPTDVLVIDQVEHPTPD
jgi:uncharacterized protein (TIGR03435 family)